MSQAIPSDVPLKPGQRVVLFLGHSASDATIGYHATVVRLYADNFRHRPSQPATWIYRLYVPYFGREVAARAVDILPTDEMDDGFLATEYRRKICEVRFDLEPDEVDNQEVRGVVQKEGQWVRFLFTKADIAVAHYEFSISADLSRPSAAVLVYKVPLSRPLSRTDVLSALTNLIGRQVLCQQSNAT